jgi:four helix bundle protein
MYPGCTVLGPQSRSSVQVVRPQTRVLSPLVLSRRPGIGFAPPFSMAKKLEDLVAYQKAQRLDVAVSAILQRPCWRRFRTLHRQLSASVESIGANIEEGFEQPTDRAFAHFLGISKGSATETAGHLRRAVRRACVSAAEAAPLVSLAQEIARMLAGFILYLHRSDYKDRGRHKQNEPPRPEDSGSEDSGLRSEDQD